jgi:hypothetical protein
MPITPPKGTSDTQWMNSFVSNADTFAQNPGVPYYPLPSTASSAAGLAGTEFRNSNGFTSGLILSTGAMPPGSLVDGTVGKYNAPGYQLPVMINHDFGFGDGSAAGGFLLYPNMANTNQMQSVYRK